MLKRLKRLLSPMGKLGYREKGSEMKRKEKKVSVCFRDLDQKKKLG